MALAWASLSSYTGCMGVPTATSRVVGLSKMMRVQNSAWSLALTLFFYFFHKNMGLLIFGECRPYRVRHGGPAAVGGKRNQIMFPCCSRHAGPASGGSCSHSGAESHRACSSPSGGSQRLCQEMAWHRVLSFMCVSVLPDVSGSSPWSYFRFCFVGSPVL